MPLPRYLKEKGELTIRDLIIRLDKAGFGSSKKQIYMWEKEGIIPNPRRIKINKKWPSRVYTKEEIDEIITKLRSYPSKKIITC